MIQRTGIFLVLNFIALAIGGSFTGNGVVSRWYMGLEKAPWTPDGWVFGASWTIIMICFAFYMAFLLGERVNKKAVIVLYAIQWILNVTWNPIFFYSEAVLLGLICISALTLVVINMLFKYVGVLKFKSVLILPYVVWMLIATSLNAYILLNN